MHLFHLLFLFPLLIFAKVQDFDAKIYVAGHRGLVGSAIVSELKKQGYKNIITRTSKELDLRDREKTKEFFEEEKPDFVYLAAAKVGGIMANKTYPADFIYDNLSIELNVIDSAYRSGVTKLLFLGSSCIYPRICPQPIKEEYLLSGYLEPTNSAYAIAKIAGIEICNSYKKQYGFNAISCMPTNLFGPNDNFHPTNSHVLAAFIKRFIEAKENDTESVTIWGTGSALREFLYVDDLAAACIHLMENYEGAETINVGTGKDISIKSLAHLIAEEVGYKGTIEHDLTKPDGTPRKLLNVDRLKNLGFEAKISLRDGIRKTIEWYKDNKA
ncbi:MAG: GDP-L-fucose synthase [Chlamydiia bacterium]|nr:GDP-L-fucose synthase [Chlamydiia bacterium]